jgi:UDP-N-acetylglucosamine acyltransferase
LNSVRHLAGADPAIAEILTFIDAERHRSLCLPAIAVALEPPAG